MSTGPRAPALPGARVTGGCVVWHECRKLNSGALWELHVLSVTVMARGISLAPSSPFRKGKFNSTLSAQPYLKTISPQHIRHSPYVQLPVTRILCLASHWEKASVLFLRSRKDVVRTKELQEKQSTKISRPEAATWFHPPIKKSAGLAQLIFENLKLPE